MRTLLALFVLASLAIQSEGLKCHTCVSANEDECNRQGSQSCPQFADACSTITGTNTVMKSCTYKAFCDKAHHSNSDMKIDCCFTEDCNGPHKGKSASHNAGAALLYNPTLMFGALLTKLAFSRL